MPLSGNSSGAEMRSGNRCPPGHFSCSPFPVPRSLTLSFHDADGARADDATAESRLMADLDDVGDVLVRLRSLFGKQAPVLGPHDDSLLPQLISDVAPGQHPDGLLAPHHPPGAVTGRAERFLDGSLRPDRDERVAAHVAGDEHGLADRAVAL